MAHAAEASSFSDNEQEASQSSEDESLSSSEGEQGRDPSPTQQPCRYYNNSGCKKGRNCTYLHICKYFFQGHCKYGQRCHLSHSAEEDNSGSSGERPRNKSYQWQIRKGSRWLDIDKDWIIEAQYSLPEVKGLRLYNTKYGRISIDFGEMKVRGKDLGIRRQGFTDPKPTTWLWYYRGDTAWHPCGEQSSNCSVTSKDIEREYQKNKRGSFRFSVGSKGYVINFKDMNQINESSSAKRRLRRRPLFVTPAGGAGSLSASMSRMSLTGGRVWQFSDSKGNWHDFTEEGCSSQDIEQEYQQDPQGKMKFTIRSSSYVLDFSAMTQKNQDTGKIRNIRRV